MHGCMHGEPPTEYIWNSFGQAAGATTSPFRTRHSVFHPDSPAAAMQDLQHLDRTSRKLLPTDGLLHAAVTRHMILPRGIEGSPTYGAGYNRV